MSYLFLSVILYIPYCDFQDYENINLIILISVGYAIFGK